MDTTLEDFIPESLIIDELHRARNKKIMVLGRSDTGKTTLVELLADRLSRETETGIVDLDMGQSHIGPPTTIAWGKTGRGFTDWEDIKAEDFYFTGTITPLGSLLPAITGAKLVTDRAVASCTKVIIDTTGFIAEPAGRTLKQYKIDLLAPDIILALEFEEELHHILYPFRLVKAPKIYTLSVPPAVGSKSSIRRGSYRFDKIQSYFSNAHSIEVPFEKVGMRFTRDPLPPGMANFKNKIVSFRNEENRDVALGIIEGIRLREKTFLVRTTGDKKQHFATMIVGRTEIDEARALIFDTDILRKQLT
ncbi:MAG: Clp1/GlmU family protein [Nitrospirota bacterium]